MADDDLVKRQEDEIGRLRQALFDILEDAEWRLENTENENYDLLMSIASKAKAVLANLKPRPNEDLDHAFIITKQEQHDWQEVKFIVKVVWTEERAKAEVERLNKDRHTHGYEPVRIERRAITDGVRKAKG